MRPGGVGQGELQVPLCQSLLQRLHLEAHDLLDVTLVEPVEHHDLVDPVQELRLEVVPHRREHGGFVGAAAEVARHDEHGVLEVDRAALAVGEAPVVHDLEQHVEHVGVRLLDLVEQDHRVGASTDGFRELPALLVADVAGRRAHQARHVVLLLVLRHVDAHHGVLVVEEEVGERPGQLRLADSRGAEEQERADGPVRVGEAGPRPPDRVRDRAHGVVLADHALVQHVLEADELLHLALHEARHRDAGPLGDDLGDVLLVDLLLEHLLLALELVELARLRLDLLLELAHRAVAKLGGPLEVTLALGALGLGARAFELLLEVTDLGDGALLVLPVSDHGRPLLGQLGELDLDRLQALLGDLVRLLRQRRLLDLELADAALDDVDLDRHRVDLDAQPRRGFVDEVDRLVRELPAADVPL